MSTWAEYAGEQFAKEMLSDPEFRGKLHRLMNAQIDRILERLEGAKA